MKGLELYFLIFLIIICSSCYETRTVNKTATIFPFVKTDGNKKFKYEILIVEHVKGRGGDVSFYNVEKPYNSIQFYKKYNFIVKEWIYTNCISGKVNADSLIYTHYQRKFDYPWSQSNLKGHIEFLSDSTLVVNFQIPYLKDGVNIDHWEDCQYNGRYRITLKNEPSPIEKTIN